MILHINDKNISEWADKIEEIYDSFYKRNDIEVWKDVLNIKDNG